MTYISGRGRRILAEVGLLLLAAACGGKSATEGNSSQTVGGNTATTVSTAQGGTQTITSTSGGATVGGAMNTGGVSVLGSTNTGGNGTASTGGKAATGSTLNIGGELAMGGSSNTGGKATTSTGGTVATGGNPGSGGASIVAATGGKAASGGASSAGGVAPSGGTSATAGNSASGGKAGSGGTSNLPDFCQGNESKVSYQGQVISAPATNYQSGLIMDCCTAYGVNLYTKPTLDFDIAVELVWQAGTGVAPAVYRIGDSGCPFHGLVRQSIDMTGYGYSTSGTGQLFTPFSFNSAWDFGFCLQVTDSSSTLLGTWLYVPRITITGYASRARLQFFLLSDTTITPVQAATSPVDSLALAAQPFLDLSGIAYMRQTTDEIGLNPGQRIGAKLPSQLGANTMALPFVLIADNVRIYMGSVGTFLSQAPAGMPVGPYILIDDIEDDVFTIRAPIAATDVRNDQRILTVLQETSRLIP